MLYKMYPAEAEGELARRHAMLVSTETLARVAKDMDLAHRVHHGHMTGGRVKHILANAVEAILGAIFIDGGFESARDIIAEIWVCAYLKCEKDGKPYADRGPVDRL